MDVVGWIPEDIEGHEVTKARVAEVIIILIVCIRVRNEWMCHGYKLDDKWADANEEADVGDQSLRNDIRFSYSLSSSTVIIPSLNILCHEYHK